MSTVEEIISDYLACEVGKGHSTREMAKQICRIFLEHADRNLEDRLSFESTPKKPPCTEPLEAEKFR